MGIDRGEEIDEVFVFLGILEWGRRLVNRYINCIFWVVICVLKVIGWFVSSWERVIWLR